MASAGIIPRAMRILVRRHHQVAIQTDWVSEKGRMHRLMPPGDKPNADKLLRTRSGPSDGQHIDL